MFSMEICECKENHGVKFRTEPYLLQGTYGTIEIFPRGRDSLNFGFCKHCDKPYLSKEKAKEIVRDVLEKRQKEKGLLTGEELRELREQTGLTVREFGALTKINYGRISAIENGYVIQSKANDQVIRMKTKEFIKRNNPARKKLKRVFAKLMQQVDTSKLFLNKIMFYVDFWNFKKTDKSITGGEYIPLQYGPCPKDYDEILQEMIDDGEITPIKGYSFNVNKEPDMSEFSKEEMETINEIISLAKHDKGQELFELSHKEKGFMETPSYETIPYEYAKDLKIDYELLEEIKKTG